MAQPQTTCTCWATAQNACQVPAERPCRNRASDIACNLVLPNCMPDGFGDAAKQPPSTCLHMLTYAVLSTIYSPLLFNCLSRARRAFLLRQCRLPGAAAHNLERHENHLPIYILCLSTITTIPFVYTIYMPCTGNVGAYRPTFPNAEIAGRRFVGRLTALAKP